MKVYNAREAAMMSDVLVDMDGTIWVHSGGRWDYITGYSESGDGPTFYGLTGWDYKTSLPNKYGPYRVLDDAATEFILGRIGVRS